MSTISNNNPAKTLLNMLSDSSANTPQPQHHSAPGPPPQASQQDNSNNFNDASQQQQTQLLIAMHQRMQNQQQQMNSPQQSNHNNQMPPPQNQMQMQSQSNQTNHQMNPPSSKNNNNVDNNNNVGNNNNPPQQQLSTQMQSLQALAQMQQNLANLQGPQLMEQRQSQISDFLSRHGHNLSDDQRLNLCQQVGNGGGPLDAILMMQLGNQLASNISGGGGMNADQMMQLIQSQGGLGLANMGDLMNRQRDQLRSLQCMLKPEDMLDAAAMGNALGGNLGQQGGGGMDPQQQQQMMMQGNLGGGMDMNQMAQVMNFRGDNQGGSSRSSQNGMVMQGNNQGQDSFFRNSTNNNQLQQQQQQQQPMQVQSQHSNPIQLQQLQQQQMNNMPQQQQQQRGSSSAVMEHMIRQRQKQDTISSSNISTSMNQQQPLQRKRSQESSKLTSNKRHHSTYLPQPSPPMSSQDQSSMNNSTRVVPVALSPRLPLTTTVGDISSASLIYTKHALNSIITSLNSRSGSTSASTSSGGRVYTIRDLSTCLGAWDLSHPSSKRNHNKDNDATAVMNDGNADTAFSFYYERSCPILLDAKLPRTTGSGISSGGGGGGKNAMVYSVEDFADDEEEELPALTGAVVLTFGADKKFTGGIGEEGVLTKAIFEFFYEPVVALGKDGSGSNKDGVDMNALVEAEEQMFARMDNEESTFIKAALHALSPSLGDGNSTVDSKVYVPTIWSGNTNRVYQYCLLGNFDDEGKELASKRLCVAIQKKAPSACGDGPAKGVCRITCTLSPASVLEEKKRMANAREGQNLNEFSSTIHRKIRQNLRCLRPPKLVSPASLDDKMGPGRRRVNLRRPSMTHLIDPSSIVVGMRCKHELLLDAEEIGKVYINGSLVVDCSAPSPLPGGKTSSKTNILSALESLSPDILPAHTLFGIDFTFPNCNQAMFFRDIPNKAVLEQEYGALLVDALIDATQFESDVAGKLLCRLISGRSDFDDDDQDEDEKKNHSRSSSKSSFFYDDDINDDINSTPSSKISFDDVSKQCIESIVLSSEAADPVGIGAKALSTKFRMHYGKEFYPCETGTDEDYRLCKILGPNKSPKTVPRRLRDILCRGGYLPLNKMAEFIWKGSGASWIGDHNDSMLASKAMEGAIRLLRQAGCNDVKPNMIRFVGRKQLEMADASVPALRCWYDALSSTYFVNDSILFVETKDQRNKCDAGTVEHAKQENSVDTIFENSNPTVSDSNAQKSDTPIESEAKAESEVAQDTDAVKVKSEADVAQDTNLDAESEVPNNEESETKDQESQSNTEAMKVTPDPEEESKDEAIAQDHAKSSSKKNAGLEDKDHTSLASSVQTDKAANSGGDKDAKLSYRPTEEVAFLLAFIIAKDHPNPMLLEKFVTCHSS
ncbi:hypothetical protein ACHAXN_003301 [Cyclotella atomus]